MTTGKGAFPFNSSWLKEHSVLRKKVIFGDRDQSLKTIMESWFFGVFEETTTEQTRRFLRKSYHRSLQ